MRTRNARQRTTVTINGTAMEIWVTRFGQSDWRARGFFNSKHIETIGLTEIEAATAWTSQATSAGSIGNRGNS